MKIEKINFKSIKIYKDQIVIKLSIGTFFLCNVDKNNPH